MSDHVISVAFEVKADQLDKAINKLEQNIEKLANKTEQSGTKMTSGFVNPMSIGLAAVTAVAWKSIDAFNEQEKALNRIGAQLKATGFASGMTKKEIADLADSFEGLTNFDDDEILGGQSTLLKFKNIGSDIFPKATAAMLDMAEVMGSDASQSAQMLGKALNNPLEASTALKKAGIDLSATQQKQIENFIKLGDVTSAQNIILKELEATIGGAAEASKSPLDQMKNQFGDLFKMIGEYLMPTFKDFAENIFKPFVEWVKNNQELFLVFAAGATALVMALTGPVGIAGAIVVVITAVYSLRDKFKMILLQMADWVLMFYETASSVIAKIAGLVSSDLEKTIGKGTEALKEYRKNLKETMDGIRADEKAAADKKEEEEKARARKGEKNQKKKGAKDLQDETPGAKDANAEAEKQEKQWEKTYGKLSALDKQFLRDKDRREKEQAKDDLQDQAKFLAKRQSVNKNMTSKQVQYELAEHSRLNQEKEDRAKYQYDFENNLGSARIDFVTNQLGTLSQLQNSKSKEAFEVGKAAAVANATISMYEGATGAYKAMAGIPVVGPALGIAAAAALVATGVMNISNISSQEPGFETGGIPGIYPGTSYRGDQISTTVNSGEMLLNFPQQKRLFDIANGTQAAESKSSGPSVVYSNNISIYADSTTDAKKLAKEVEKVINKKEKRMREKQKFTRTV